MNESWMCSSRRYSLSGLPFWAREGVQATFWFDRSWEELNGTVLWSISRKRQDSSFVENLLQVKVHFWQIWELSGRLWLRQKETKEDAGRMSDRLDSIPKFSLKPSLCEDYFLKACDTPEWEVTEERWELECYGCLARAESSREFGRLPTRTDGRRVRGPDVVLAMVVAIWWAMPLSIRHHVVSSRGDEDRPGSWSVQGLEATKEWLTSRPPVTGEPGLLLGTVRGSDHYPHSRGTISRVVPQGFGESA